MAGCPQCGSLFYGSHRPSCPSLQGRGHHFVGASPSDACAVVVVPVSTLLALRDALVARDVSEGYHILRKLADPDCAMYDKHGSHWSQWEEAEAAQVDGMLASAVPVTLDENGFPDTLPEAVALHPELKGVASKAGARFEVQWTPPEAGALYEQLQGEVEKVFRDAGLTVQQRAAPGDVTAALERAWRSTEALRAEVVRLYRQHARPVLVVGERRAP